MFQKFSPPHLSTLLCSNVVKFVRREIGEIVRYLPDKKNFSSLSNRQGQPPTFDLQCSKLHPNRFTFGGVIAERVKVVLAHRVFPWFASNTFEANKQYFAAAGRGKLSEWCGCRIAVNYSGTVAGCDVNDDAMTSLSSATSGNASTYVISGRRVGIARTEVNWTGVRVSTVILISTQNGKWNVSIHFRYQILTGILRNQL